MTSGPDPGRELGFAGEGLRVAEDFDAPLPAEIPRTFYGDDPDAASCT